MKRLSRVARVGRDLCFVGMGVLSLTSTPNSLNEGLSYHLTWVWSAVLVCAGLLCLAGWLGGRPMVEVHGCLFAAAGMLTWIVAALSQSTVTTTSFVLSLLLLSGVFGQLYRIAEVVQSIRPVEWPEVEV